MRRNVQRVISATLIVLILAPCAFAAGRTSRKAPSGVKAAAAAYEVKETSETWTMQDGVKLPVSVYSPVPKYGGELFPVVVFVHPWDTIKAIYDSLARKYATRGYVGVTYSVRGWFGAEGDVNAISPDFEMKDLSRIITLVSEDGRFPVLKDAKGPVVGVTGYSMGGVHSYLIAPRANPRPGDPGDPRVRAVAPLHGSTDLSLALFPYRAGKIFWTVALIAGAYFGNLAGMMLDIVDLVMNPNLDPWQKLSAVVNDLMKGLGTFLSRVSPELMELVGTVYERRYKDYAKVDAFLKKRSARYWCDAEMDGLVEHPITAPMLIVAGWNDDLFSPNDHICAFNSLVAAPKRMIMTNGGHAGDFPLPWNLGQPPDPEKVWIEGEVQAWFDHFLKGVDNGTERGPAVTYYKDWDPAGYGTSDVWPPAGTADMTYNLGGSTGFRRGALTTGSSSSPQADLLVNFGFSGSISLPYVGDITRIYGGAPMDIPEKVDILYMPFQRYSYVSEPLSADTLVNGTPRLKLSYVCSSNFAQINPRLYEVTPEGKEILITRGYYEGYSPNIWTRLNTGNEPIEMVACSHRVKAGSRLKLEVQTSDLAQVWPAWGFSFIYIFHDAPGASALVLPMAPG